MEELGEGLKELKGFATPQEEQQYQPTRPPELLRTKPPTKEYIWGGPMAPAAYVAEDGLVWYQWQGRPLAL